MKPDDLTQLKYIGSARLGLLKSHGIRTIAQLDQAPLEQVAAIKTLGNHYGRLLKKEARRFCAQRKADSAKRDKLSPKKTKVPPLDRDLTKAVKRLRKRMRRTAETLKPLWKKKYLAPYVEFKSKSKKFKSQLRRVTAHQEHLPKKAKKRLIIELEGLAELLAERGKKRRKKNYQKINAGLKRSTRSIVDLSQRR